jgi:ClpP class serine protease
MRNLAHLAGRLYNTPLLIHPDKAEVIERVFAAKLGADLALPLAADIDKPTPEAVAYASPRYVDKPYIVTEGQVAVIPVMGSLVQRAGVLDAMSGLTGYNRIERLFRMAQADRDVRGVLLELDSPGGEGSGLFDLADLLSGAEKPTWAAVNEMAYSAGYAVAAATQRIAVTRTAGTGSVGVIALHMDQSERDAKEGRRYTAIYAGARKNDFTSHEPLSTDARRALQASIDRMYALFIDHVAAARKLSADAVRATEAGLFEGALAVEIGFADVVQPFNDTLQELEQHVAGTRTHFSTQGIAARHAGVHSMNESNNPAAGGETANVGFSQADLDRARAEGHAAGIKAGAESERTRITGIYGHAEATGRRAMADKCVSMGLTVEQAGELLAAAPRESAPQAAANPFAAAMAAMGNPATSGVEAPETDTPDESALAAQVLAAFRQ